jgi:hypothetical protein
VTRAAAPWGSCQLSEGPVEDVPDHQQHRAVERGVPPAREDPGRTAHRGQCAPAPRRPRGGGADHPPQARRLHAARGGDPAADAVRRVNMDPCEGISRYGRCDQRGSGTKCAAAPSRRTTLDPAQEPEGRRSTFSTSSGTPPSLINSEHAPESIRPRGVLRTGSARVFVATVMTRSVSCRLHSADQGEASQETHDNGTAYALSVDLESVN